MESAPCVGASCVHAILELLCSENVASESKSLLKMLRDGAARLQPAHLLAPAHDRRLAAKRPKAEGATTILAHILDVGFAAADPVELALVKIPHSRQLDLLAVGQVRREPRTQAVDDIRARIF